jgi:hypothetical protein
MPWILIDSALEGTAGITSWCTASPTTTRPARTGTIPNDTTASRSRSRPVVSKSSEANSASRHGRDRIHHAGRAGGLNDT